MSYMWVSETSAAFPWTRFRGLAHMTEKRARVPSLARMARVQRPSGFSNYGIVWHRPSME